ncbi:MAG: PIN domain-containing protein [Promethearchaeia archaeon]
MTEQKGGKRIPLIELDLIVGLISEEDTLHEIAKEIFTLINSKQIKNISIPSSVFLEYELLLKSKKIETNEIVKDLVNFRELNDIKEIPLTSSVLIHAFSLRNQYNLTYFDSLHCASALHVDGVIIGTDSDFDEISNLTLISPTDFLKDHGVDF